MYSLNSYSFLSFLKDLNLLERFSELLIFHFTVLKLLVVCEIHLVAVELQTEAWVADFLWPWCPMWDSYLCVWCSTWSCSACLLFCRWQTVWDHHFEWFQVNYGLCYVWCDVWKAQWLCDCSVCVCWTSIDIQWDCDQLHTKNYIMGISEGFSMFVWPFLIISLYFCLFLIAWLGCEILIHHVINFKVLLFKALIAFYLDHLINS